MAKPPHDMKGIAALLAAQGRNGDTMLAHINPQEAALLKAIGGSGTINPNTGLPEYGLGRLNPFRIVKSVTGVDLIDTARKITGGVAGGLEDVAQKLGQTIEAIASDPKKLAAVAIMVAFPGAASAVGDFILGDALAVDALVASGAMSAAEASMIGASTLGSGSVASAIVGQAAINAATNGGNVENAVKAALIQQGLPAAMKSDVMQSLNKDMVDLLGKYGAQATTQAGLAAIMGKDPVAAFVFSGAQAATDLIFQQAKGYTSNGITPDMGRLPDSAQNAIKAAITAKLTGKDAASAVASSLVASTVNASKNYIAIQKELNSTGAGTTLTGSQLAAIQNPEAIAKNPWMVSAAIEATKQYGLELPDSLIAGITEIAPQGSQAIYDYLKENISTPAKAIEIQNLAKQKGFELDDEQALLVAEHSSSTHADATTLDNTKKYLDLVKSGDATYDEKRLQNIAYNTPGAGPVSAQQLEWWDKSSTTGKEFDEMLKTAGFTRDQFDNFTKGTSLNNINDFFVGPEESAQMYLDRIKEARDNKFATYEDAVQASLYRFSADDYYKRFQGWDSADQKLEAAANNITDKNAYDLWLEDQQKQEQQKQTTVADNTQQIIDAINNPQVTPGPGTQVADAGTTGNGSVVSDSPTSNVIQDILAGTGSNQLTEQELQDIVSGGIGDATLEGGTGQDTLVGGQDSVVGGEATTQGGTGTDTIVGGAGTGTTIKDDDGNTLTVNPDGTTEVTQSTLPGGTGASDIITGGTTQPNIEHYADGTYKVTYEDGTSAIFNADGTPYSTVDNTGTNTISVFADATSPSGYRDSLGQPVNQDGTPYVAPAGNDTLTGGQSTVTGGQSTVAGGQSTVAGGQSTVPGGQSTVPGGQSTVPGGGSGGLNLGALMALLGQGQGQQAPTPPPVVDIGEQLDLEEALQTNPFAKKKTQSKMAEGGSIDDLLALLQQRG